MKTKLTLPLSILLLTAAAVTHAEDQTITRTVQVDLTSQSRITSTIGSTGVETIGTPNVNTDGTRTLTPLNMATIGFTSDGSNASSCEMIVSSPNVDSNGKFLLMPASGTDANPISFSLTANATLFGNTSYFTITPSNSVSGSPFSITGGLYYAVEIKNNWSAQALASNSTCGIRLDSLYATNFSQTAIPSSMTGTRTATINFLMRVI